MLIGLNFHLNITKGSPVLYKNSFRDWFLKGQELLIFLKVEVVLQQHQMYKQFIAMAVFYNKTYVICVGEEKIFSFISFFIVAALFFNDGWVRQ